MFGWIKNIFGNNKTVETEEERAMRYMIVGLGNVGMEYEGTRHNSGFMVVDALAKDADVKWTLGRLAMTAEMKLKGKQVLLVKPTTFMNLSGKAVRYWMNETKTPLENVLVVVDDIALPVGELRMKKQGGAGGHNGLTDIEQLLGTNAYCRLRVGIGDRFSKGRQIDYVLGRFTADELATMEPKLTEAVEMIKTFVTQGADRAMNMFNHRKGANER
jgi:PTH1 family peptidyl-tRNA hydrolase